MKKSEIKIVGKQIFEADLEIGDVQILVDVDNILDDIDTDVLRKYVEYHLDMIDPDDCECETVDEASEWELVDELKSRGFNFEVELDDDDLLDEVAARRLGEHIAIQGLDYVDTELLKEITTLFLNSTLSQRQIMYNLLIK
jgi:hypothetical protein